MYASGPKKLVVHFEGVLLAVRMLQVDLYLNYSTSSQNHRPFTNCLEIVDSTRKDRAFLSKLVNLQSVAFVSS